MKKVFIVVVAFVVGFFGFLSSEVQADVVVDNTESSGSIQLGGFNVWWYASNQEACTYSYTDDDGLTWTYYEEKQTWGSLSNFIEQGAMGYYFVPARQEVRLRRYNDDGLLQLSCSFYYMLSEEPVDWNELPSIRTDFDLFGLRYDMGAQVQHGWDGFWDEYLGVWFDWQTDDVDASFWYNIRNAETLQASVDVSSWNYWAADNSLIEGLRVPATFDIQWYGSEEELEFVNQSVPLVVPEPATMGLIGFGLGLVLVRRLSLNS